MRPMVLSLCLCLVAISSTLYADQVFLKNGDHLTGKIVGVADGKMVLKSEFTGEVTVAMKDIQTFNSDSAIEVHLKDGTVLHQPVSAAGSDRFTIVGGQPLQPQTFALADIVSINPPPKPEPKWTGSISAAVSAARGNTTSDSISASFSTVRRSDIDRTTVGADYGRSTQRDRTTGQDTTTEDWWRTKAQYDYFFTKRFFGFANGRYEKDAIAELDRRVVLGGGAGYQWIETDVTSFSTDIGLASLYERFKNQTDTNSRTSLQAGYNFSTRFWDVLTLAHDLTYFPGLNKFSDYYLTSTTELRATLTKTMFANFKVIFDYNTTPAVGRGNTDVKYLFGLGINF